MRIVYDAEEQFKAAKAAANPNDPQTMIDLYNAAASKFYLDRTKKTFEDLEKSGWYADSRWSDWGVNCDGSAWKTIEECIECAGLAADQAIEDEEADE